MIGANQGESPPVKVLSTTGLWLAAEFRLAGLGGAITIF